MTDFAESIRGWGSDDGDAEEEYERLLAAYKQVLGERNKLAEITGGSAAWIDKRFHDAVELMQQMERERDEARGTAEMALAIAIKLRKDWNAEDADLVLNDVPWKRSELIREISARVLKKMREKEGR